MAEEKNTNKCKIRGRKHANRCRTAYLTRICVESEHARTRLSANEINIINNINNKQQIHFSINMRQKRRRDEEKQQQQQKTNITCFRINIVTNREMIAPMRKLLW